ANKFETHGVDINGRMMAVAKRNLENNGTRAVLRQGNVEHLPYEDEYFDTVVNTMAFSGYPDGSGAMSEMRRVLKTGGRFILIDVNYPADHNWLGMRLTGFWQRLGDIIRNVSSLLEEHGFDYEDTEIGGFGSVHMYICQKR
ncbi:uncharacterized protein METZ01_LOCUS484822, partial [marine metagenome]